MELARPRAAVIGSGVAGLTAAHILQRSYDVTLYEADGRLGGHADTHEVAGPDGALIALDTGFIVHNERTYPQLVRLFAELGVDTQPTEMSMSVRCQGCGLEYAGSLGAGGLFPRPGNLVRPSYARLLACVPAFYRQARRLLGGPADDSLTLGEFLRAGHYPRYFTAHFVIPLVAAVWSCSPAEALGYPAAYLFRFLDHHDMLSVGRSTGWRTVTGGSRGYVDRIAKGLSEVRLGTAVRAVRRGPFGVEVTDTAGASRAYRGAVIATHPDQALRLLESPAPAEREVLGAFRYRTSAVALHTDAGLLPRAGRARASWNYLLGDCAGAAEQVHVSYYLNRLHRLAGPPDYLVTLNALDQIRPGSVIDRMSYAHPLYTPESVAAQRRLPDLNSPVLAYAGAYHGWGFHEDGCLAGVRAAAALGVRW
jgi:predicted NAD/FAD-binding protein